MNRTKTIQNLLLALGLTTGAIAIMLMLTGCSAAKKAQKAQTRLNKEAVKVANNKEATGVFYNEYSKTHDITEGKTVYLPGKEVIKETVKRDTIKQPGKTTIHRETFYTDRLQVDTLIQDSKETLANLKLSKTQNDELDAALAGLQTDFLSMEKKLKAEIKEWKKEVYVHRGIWIAIILFFVIRFASKFLKPLLSLYFPGLKFLNIKNQQS